jgi:hypothetical protein
MSSWLGALLAAAIAGDMVTACSAANAQELLSVRDQRCARMHQQLQSALIQAVSEDASDEARKLNTKALHLCASGRQSQGLRAFSAALEVLQKAGADR